MDGSVNFYRSWQTYKEGFGKADGEYWLGKRQKKVKYIDGFLRGTIHRNKKVWN